MCESMNEYSIFSEHYNCALKLLQSFAGVPKVQNKIETGPHCLHQVLFGGWRQAL